MRGANTMFIDLVVVTISILMFTKAMLLGLKMEMAIWFILWIYALLNASERNLKGSKYDY